MELIGHKKREVHRAKKVSWNYISMRWSVVNLPRQGIFHSSSSSTRQDLPPSPLVYLFDMVYSLYTSYTLAQCTKTLSPRGFTVPVGCAAKANSRTLRDKRTLHIETTVYISSPIKNYVAFKNNYYSAQNHQ